MKIQRLALCAAPAVLLAACSSGASTVSGSGSSSTRASGSSTAEIVVENYTFPAIATTPGATIRFVDRDAEAHTVTADDATFKIGPFDSASPGLLIAPAKPGTYAFHCEIHPTMHGTLVVQNS